MAMSSGGRGIVADLAGWSVALMVGAVAIVYAPEIKAVGYAAFGMQPLDAHVSPRSARRSRPTRKSASAIARPSSPSVPTAISSPMPRSTAAAST